MWRTFHGIAGGVLASCLIASATGCLVAPTLWAAEARAFRTPVSPAAGSRVVLYAEEAGDGPPVLLLHGLGESTFTWRNIVPALAERHRVIALDLKGFGRSEKPIDDAYSADDQAALVAAFMEVHGLEDVTLIGHSFGGTVALRTVHAAEDRDRNRVRRLVVIAAPALPNSTAPYFDLVQAPAVPDALTAAFPPDMLARILLREARGGSRVIPEEDVKGYAAPYYELDAKRAFLATARSIVSEEGDEIARRYRTIKQPTLVVWCRNDPVVPLAAGRKLAKLLPEARLAIMKGCHHLPQDERPAALLAILRPFLDQ